MTISEDELKKLKSRYFNADTFEKLNELMHDAIVLISNEVYEQGGKK